MTVETGEREQTDHALFLEDDPGSRVPASLAGVMALALVLWLVSGLSGTGNAPTSVGEQSENPLATVVVWPSRAQAVPRVFVAEGHALPDRDTIVFAESTGDISAVHVAKGDEVAAQTSLAQFDAVIEQAQLKRAAANLEKAKRDSANAERLTDSGTVSFDRLVAARAELADAESQMALAEDALSRTTIRSPFPGRVEELRVEAGQLVAMGAPVARIVDLDPLTVRVRVPQQSLAPLEVGQDALVRFITGETREGKVTFLGANADAETRTFLLEMEVPNATAQIPAGLSAQVASTTGSSDAHFVSPATLTLSLIHI